MSTIISRPFRFTEFQLFDAPSNDENGWKPVALPDNRPPPRLTGKFVYAFQVLGADTQLFAEILADAQGKLAVTPGRVARTTERDKRAAPAATNTDVFTLPHTINGKRAFYFFLVSRIRLHVSTINDLEVTRPPALVPLDLEKDGSFLLVGGSDGNSTTIETFLPVIDPITIGINLHTRYEQACNELIAFTMEFKEQSDAQRTRVRDRHKALFLAKLLQSVVEGDPSDKLGLKNEFKNDDPSAPKKFIETYDKTVEDLVKRRDRLVEPLVHFLAGKLLETAENSYLVTEKDDYAAFLSHLEVMYDRINEAPLGKARIGKLIDNPTFAFREYVLRTSPAPDAKFSVGRKANSAILGLWKEAVPGVLSKAPNAAEKIANALKFIARIELVKVEAKEISYTYRKKNGRLRTVTKTVQETTAIAPATALAKWAQDGLPGRGLERLAQGIEIANLTLALVSLANAEPGEDRGFALLNLFGSVLDGVSAFNAFLKIGERSIKIVGGVSAAVDTVLAARDGINAYGRDDTSSAVGFGIVATGSVLTLAGCVCAAAGLAAGATVVGIPLAAFLEVVGAVLVGAGWILAVFSADSEIELFVSHCMFGKNSNSGSKDKPKWASAAFGTWSQPGGLDHQVKSLLTILAAFTVKATDYTGINVQLGLTMSGSKLRIKFDAGYNLGITHRPDLLIDIGQQSMQQFGGDPQDPSRLRVGESNGRPFVQITADWPPNVRPPKAIQHQYCMVEVQLLLDDQGNTVPIQKALSYRVHELNSILSGPLSSHE
ncbi:MAG TPA: hypothetical protein VFQ35_01305 [Polyangiaceae bacterium]|nr:hypothetical protein [Polyangiaceae bacterium]